MFTRIRLRCAESFGPEGKVNFLCSVLGCTHLNVCAAVKELKVVYFLLLFSVKSLCRGPCTIKSHQTNLNLDENSKWILFFLIIIVYSWSFQPIVLFNQFNNSIYLISQMFSAKVNIYIFLEFFKMHCFKKWKKKKTRLDMCWKMF